MHNMQFTLCLFQVITAENEAELAKEEVDNALQADMRKRAKLQRQDREYDLEEETCELNEEVQEPQLLEELNDKLSADNVDLSTLGPNAHMTELGISASPLKGIAKSLNGDFKLELSRENNDELDYKFIIRNDELNENELNRTFTYSQDREKTNFEFKAPEPGKYVVQVCSGKKNEKLQEVGRYVVDVCKDLPEDALSEDGCPGGKFGNICSEALLEPVSHSGGFLTVESNEPLRIVMKMLEPVDIKVSMDLHKKKEICDLSKHAWCEKEGNLVKCCFNFPKSGIYVLKLFARKENTNGPFDIQWKYLADVYDPTSNARPFPNVLRGWNASNKMLSPQSGQLAENENCTFKHVIPGKY